MKIESLDRIVRIAPNSAEIVSTKFPHEEIGEMSVF